MAEFCKDCFKRIHGDLMDKDDKLEMSNNLDLCEGCGGIKPVVISIIKANKKD